MVDPTPLDAPEVATVSSPAVAVEQPAAAPAPVTVTLPVAEIQRMIAEAVAAGAASASGIAPVGAAAVPPAPLPDWSANELLKQLAGRTRWFTETSERAAYQAIDKHFPAPEVTG